MTRPVSRRLRWAFRLGTLTGVILLLGLVGEGVARARGIKVALNRHYEPGMFRADPLTCWSLKQGYAGKFLAFTEQVSIRTNARGFRGPELGPDGGERILCIGDSNTFGYGVQEDETHSAVAQRLLREAGRSVEVVNMGVPGWSTGQERDQLVQLGLPLHPRAVVLQWNTNDIPEMGDVWNKRVIDGELVRGSDVATYELLTGDGPVPLWAHSELLKLIDVKWRIARHRWGGTRGAPTAFDLDPVPRADYEPTFAAIAEIASACRANGARLLVFDPPGREEIERGLMGRHHEYVRELCGKIGAGWIDVYAATRAAYEKNGHQDMFVERDSGHPNAAGHAIVGELIARWYRGG
jgi:lysophospholipase L1-like esterase